MGIPILVRRYIYIETGPWILFSFLNRLVYIVLHVWINEFTLFKHCGGALRSLSVSCYYCFHAYMSRWIDCAFKVTPGTSFCGVINSSISIFRNVAFGLSSYSATLCFGYSMCALVLDTWFSLNCPTWYQSTSLSFYLGCLLWTTLL